MPVTQHPEPDPTRTAYITMLCHGDGYAPGVEALGHSLVHSGSTRRRVVMVTPEVSDETCARLTGQGFEVRRMPWLGRSGSEVRGFARFGNLPQVIAQFMRAQPCFAAYLGSELRVIHCSVQRPCLNEATLVGDATLWWSVFYGARGQGEDAFWGGFTKLPTGLARRRCAACAAERAAPSPRRDVMDATVWRPRA